jgi:L-galactose dehydrogenase
VRYRTLGSNGQLVSELGFGASPLGGIYGTFAEQDAVDAVHSALDVGINFLDVSPYYGLTAAETMLGKALRGIARDRYVLATKVGRYSDEAFDFSAARVTRSVRESLDRLGAGYIDLIQCHDVEFASLDQIIGKTIPALRALQDSGLVRWVGVTGYPLAGLLHIARRISIDTVMSYCEYTLQDRRLTSSAADFTAAGAAIINASPLAMGALTSRGAPPWHPAPPGVLALCAQAAALCQQRGASLDKLALQFSVTTTPCVTTVVGSASAANIRRDATWISEPIDTGLLAEVEAVLAPVRDTGWLNGRPENHDPGRAS